MADLCVTSMAWEMSLNENRRPLLCRAWIFSGLWIQKRVCPSLGLCLPVRCAEESSIITTIVNEALIEGLKTAVFVLEKEEELSKERKKSMIESLKGLIAQSDEIYGEPPTKD